jgi:hypothetical protein
MPVTLSAAMQRAPTKEDRWIRIEKGGALCVRPKTALSTAHVTAEPIKNRPKETTLLIENELMIENLELDLVVDPLYRGVVVEVGAPFAIRAIGITQSMTGNVPNRETTTVMVWIIEEEIARREEENIREDTDSSNTI